MMKISYMKRFYFVLSILACLVPIGSVLAQQNDVGSHEPRRITLMGIGDSITEGAGHFNTYLPSLWELLFANGYHVDFIGPRSTKFRMGDIQHCGFGGKTIEFLNSKIDSLYSRYPADVVLIHAGHNYDSAQKPVDGIVANTRSVIEKILRINPEAMVLVAQVIGSGKLPKYDYIPQLNKRLATMVRAIHQPNVHLVDQYSGFKWEKHTIDDKVHPNHAGAQQMAAVWFKALNQLLPQSEKIGEPIKVCYKKSGSRDLNLYVFTPKKWRKGEARPVVAYFFGGGWSMGTPLQFYRECSYLASQGIVAIAVDYRIAWLDRSTPFESLEDARDAIRWIRMNAGKWNIDPQRIAAAGASAGGHLAAATATIESSSVHSGLVSSQPNLLLLYYPVVDNSPEGYGSAEVKQRYQEISPLHNITPNTPPALFVLGSNDHLVPVATGQAFKARMAECGVECELHLFEGAGHPIFYYAKDLTPEYYSIRKLTMDFLFKHGYLEGKP